VFPFLTIKKIDVRVTTVKSIVANGAELSHLIQEPMPFLEIYP
jgi:hypothetical protein